MEQCLVVVMCRQTIHVKLYCTFTESWHEPFLFFQTSKASKVHFSGLSPLMVLDFDATLHKQEIPRKSATVFPILGSKLVLWFIFANLKWKSGPMQILLRLSVTVEVKVMKWKKKNCDITYYLYSLLTMHKVTVRVLWQIINWTGQKRM